jgi:hypothetical protein
MKVKWLKILGSWSDVKSAARSTIGKDGECAEPSDKWKKQIMLAEHSPIRKIKVAWKWEELPYWVSVHFVRHKFGIEHFVSTQRTDRTGEDRTVKQQDAPVSHECEANLQAIINISRKRLCNKAALETRIAWKEVKKEIAKHDSVIASCMVRECVYRGFCPEMKPCGFVNTIQYKIERKEYIGQ